jgi:hypothetical protein
MRAILFLVVIITFTGCASRISITDWKKEADETRVLLMRAESDVYGDYFKLRIFHSDLMQMPGDTSKAPYPSLEEIFNQCIPQANGVVIQRMVYDTTYFALQTMMTGKKKINKKGDAAILYDRYVANKNSLPSLQQSFKRDYFILRKNYQDTCQNYGVKRLGPEEYAGMINERITTWLDSLEEVGRMIGQSKAHLRSQFSNHKAPEYFTAYKPLSELEALLKNFDSILTQLQNSLSRFEEGNKEDYLYFGPHLRPRMEVQATEDLFIQATILMAQCREKNTEYYAQYNPDK